MDKLNLIEHFFYALKYRFTIDIYLQVLERQLSTQPKLTIIIDIPFICIFVVSIIYPRLNEVYMYIFYTRSVCIRYSRIKSSHIMCYYYYGQCIKCETY